MIAARLRGLAAARRQRARLRRDGLAQYPTLASSVVEAYADNPGYAMPLSCLARLDFLVRRERPQAVLEIGSGISTIVLRTALAETGGTLVTVEADLEWIRASHAAGAGNVIIVSPGGVELVRAAVGEALRPDLVVVDGPAAAPRFSADRLALFLELARPDAAWLLDDTDRADNDGAARAIAAERGLERHDFGDPGNPGHRYTFLLPAGVAPLP